MEDNKLVKIESEDGKSYNMLILNEFDHKNKKYAVLMEMNNCGCDDDCDCEHDHEHSHGCGHSHECGSSCGSSGECKNETVALLSYMLDHNEHHAAELDQMAENLQKLGAAAKQIREAVSDFQKGNLRLSLALTTVKEQLKEA